jgi:asparagine synthase (glutamine-hydrolysing)
MCGIAGLIRFQSNRQIVGIEIKKMLSCMKHRGPDQEGFVIFNDSINKIALGNRRLSIVDVNGGRQPFINSIRKVSVIQNGEIYNYSELKKKLTEIGYAFKSDSDTEVILNLYLEYGEDFVQYLDGMFAICVFDNKIKKLFLARDRNGKKPLFYSLKDKVFYFSSEINSIQTLLNDKSINYDAINSYLTYLTIPQNQCVFKYINKLQPGQILSIDQNSKIKVKKYLNDSLQYLPSPKFNDCLEQFKFLFNKAVKKRLIGEKEIGCFLSGGLDSSLVALELSKTSEGNFKTFSAGFEQAEFNELLYAKRVSKIIKSNHYDIIIKPKLDDIIRPIIRNLGEPFGDSSIIPTYHLSKLASEHVSVVLSGDGGDEIFGGYNHQLAWKLTFNLKKIPFLSYLTTNFSKQKKISRDQSTLSRIKRMFASLRYNDMSRYAYYHTIFTTDEKKKLFKNNEKFLNSKDNFDLLENYYNDFRNLNSSDIALRLDQKWLLPNDFLVKMDTASMANSLEVRSPFLDNDVVNFVNSLPPDWKINFFEKKYFLKKILEKNLPSEIVYRKKQGFNIPLDYWMRYELKDYFYNIIINGNFIKNNFNMSYVEELYEKHIKNIENNGNKLWLLYILEMWSSEFL